MSIMPVQKPGRSKQDYQTPIEFLKAVRSRLYIWQFDWDLAADEKNTVVPDKVVQNTVFRRHYNEADDSLVQDWKLGDGWNWCNPPYADIEPWVAKAAREAQKGAQTAMLIPASVGSNWWKTWVEPYAYTVFLNGRLCFIPDWKEQGFKSKPLYPKDCALLLYTPWGMTGTEVWTWEA